MLETLAAAATGIALAASAGLRAFLPLFAAGAAARWFQWPLASPVSWLASDPALVLFGIASTAEVLADKVPAVDHLLDLLQSVLSPIAGALAALAALQGWPAPFALALAIIVGAPVASGFHAIGAITRVKSSATTAGTANPVLSLAEDIVAAVLIVLAFLLPIVVVLVIAVLAWRWLRRRAGGQTAGRVEGSTP
jgi:hypothetical protein